MNLLKRIKRKENLKEKEWKFVYKNIYIELYIFNIKLYFSDKNIKLEKEFINI